MSLALPENRPQGGAGPDAGDFFSRLRTEEFSRLDREGLAYLDYAGSALYGDSQVRAHAFQLGRSVFGNPHSEHSASRLSAQVIEAARERALRHFDVDSKTHVLCFTANTTAAIKLIAESYPFGTASSLLLSADNHNSVNGMREYARLAGASAKTLPLDEALRLRDPEEALAEASRQGRGLLAYPAQSNFSGAIHPLSLVTRARELGFDVLLDMAAFAPTHALSLRACPADFAVLSFYKMFGLPTGLGALIARRDALAKLQRPWFSGGTVEFVSVQLDRHRLRRRHEGFEDGTLNFLGIAALDPGFDLLARVGSDRLTAHVGGLASSFLTGIGALRHTTGVPLVLVHGPADGRERGGIVAFNLRDLRGEPIPFSVVEERATHWRVALRGGCFCNPGAAEAAFAFDATKTGRCLGRLEGAFSIPAFRECMGGDVGALRASFGLANIPKDVDRAIDLIASFLDQP